MVTRRQILAGAATATLATLPSPAAPVRARTKSIIPLRLLGRTGRMVTPFGLGGQGALQWTPEGVDPADIVVRAIEQGVTYLDTSNLYGDSQLHYGEAFRRLHLTTADARYDAGRRESLFFATKTRQRFGRDPAHPDAATAVDEIRRSLTQAFGDGKGFIPEGAYLDLMQMHALGGLEEIDDIYLGMEARGGRMPDRIGVLATLIDYRDGTDYTGLNPEHRRWIRHIGVSGHGNSAVLMRMLRRDETRDLDTLLVALNVCDKLYLPHQTNVLPLAVARGMGVIAMKVFADGVFFGKEPHWTRGPKEVVTTVGQPGNIDYRALIRYTVSLPGVSTAIVGIGHIDRKDASKDQLVSDLAAAIDTPMTEAERTALEQEAAARFGAGTNYFQAKAQGLQQPTEVKLEKNGERVKVTWQAGCAGAKPIREWQIRSGGALRLTVPFRPQETLAPLFAYLKPEEAVAPVEVIAID